MVFSKRHFIIPSGGGLNEYQAARADRSARGAGSGSAFRFNEKGIVT